MSTPQKSETQRQKRRYTMSAAALAARSAGGVATARVRPPAQPRQWATVVVPLATRATAEDLRAPGEPLWRPIARALEAAKNREKTDPSA